MKIDELIKELTRKANNIMCVEPIFQDCIRELEELQKYKAIGTVEECKKAADKQKAVNPVVKLGVQSIDFIEYEDGHREAKPKIENQYTCPRCGGYISRLLIISDKYVACKKKRYCDRCGQKLDWGN